MPACDLLCPVGTTFSESGDFDAQAYREYLQRFIDAHIGVVVASAIAGEGHALLREEIAQIYATAVETCRGVVPVIADPPEQHTVGHAIAHAQLAAEAGVDGCTLYGPTGWGMINPTSVEYSDFCETYLEQVQIPITLRITSEIGYIPNASAVADVCNTFPHVDAVDLSAIKDTKYFLELLDGLRRQVDIFIAQGGSLDLLEMGAAGVVSVEANLLPKTHRQAMDLYTSEEFGTIGAEHTALARAAELLQKWGGGAPRWIKLAMTALQLPGAAGGLRNPYLPPTDIQVAKFTEELVALDIPEIDEMARAANLK